MSEPPVPVTPYMTGTELRGAFGTLEDDNTWTGKQTFRGSLIVSEPWLDVRARGATGTDPTADTAAIQQALTDVRAAGGTVLIPRLYETNAPLVLAGRGVHVRGVSRENAGIINNTTDLIQLGDGPTSFVQSSMSHLRLRSNAGGGHVFKQVANTSQCDFTELSLYQYNDAKSIFDSNNIGLVETFWRSIYAQHSLTATVPSWNLYCETGGLNRNTWQGMRVQYSGDYVWHVEEKASGNYARDNVWRDINAQTCNGGVLRLLSTQGGTVEHVACYDFTTTTKDLFVVSRSTAGYSFARFRDIHRVGGTLGADLVDLRLLNSSVTVIDGWTSGTLDLGLTRSTLRDLDGVTLLNAQNAIENTPRGPVFRSPDGTRYIISVANGGALSAIVHP